MGIKDRYFHLFSKDENFKREYLNKRLSLYKKIIFILKKLKVTSFLDIGCAYGLLVEEGCREGIKGYGFDLPIDELKQFHSNLEFSKGRFIYGDANNPLIIQIFDEEKIEAAVLMDILRYLQDSTPSFINNLDLKWILIKEVSNNFIIRRLRKNQFDVKLYSPIELLNIFSNFDLFEIYPTKFLFCCKSKNSFLLKIINLFPSYTMILRRKNL